MTQLAREVVLIRHGEPWALSFSYGRPLQVAALATWPGRHENVSSAQRRAFYHRARCNGLAARGAYTDAEEKRARAVAPSVSADWRDD